MVFALKLTLVLHSGLQSVMLFIFHISRVHMELFSLSRSVHGIIYSLLLWMLYFLTPYPWVHLCECKHAHTLHTRAHAHKHCKHAHILYTHSSLNPSIIVFLFSSSCVFSLSTFFTSALSLAHKSPRSTQHTQAGKYTQARTHKVARLVGAMAAALLRSPRVAPGARLPVVCQPLRVEFIQIKAVEWGPSPRMPRPSPSSAFRRWE